MAGQGGRGNSQQKVDSESVMYQIIGRGGANVILLDANHPAVVVRLLYAVRDTKQIERINSAVWCSSVPTLLDAIQIAIPSHQFEKFLHDLGTTLVYKSALRLEDNWPVTGGRTMGKILPNMRWLPDCINTYSVEIKPKCGFVPDSPFIHPDNRVKHSTCRYQLHQHLKLQQGTVSALSSYVPMDLFSVDEDRQISALLALMDNPQNNFKMWLNGRPQSLPMKERNIAISGPSGLTRAVLLESLLSILRASDVLSSVLAAQRLDAWDIEGMYPLYCHAKFHIEHGCENECNNRMCEDIKTCSWFQQWHDGAFTKPGGTTQACDWRAAHASLHESSWQDVISMLRQYLISMAAKDCSIMCAFTVNKPGQQLASENQADQNRADATVTATGKTCSACMQAAASLLASDTGCHTDDEIESKETEAVHSCCHFLQTSEHALKYRIAIMDMDPKHASRIDVQSALDQSILACYKDYKIHR